MCVFGCVVGATKCAWVNHPVFAVKIKWQTNVVTYQGLGGGRYKQRLRELWLG